MKFIYFLTFKNTIALSKWKDMLYNDPDLPTEILKLLTVSNQISHYNHRCTLHLRFFSILNEKYVTII